MKRISVILSLIIALVLLVGPMIIVKEVIFPKTSKVQTNRLHLNSGNTIRVMGKDAVDIGIETAKILFPSTDEESSPKGYIVLGTNNWQEILSVIPLMAKYRSPILIMDNQRTEDIINHIKSNLPLGIDELEGIQILAFNITSKSIRNKLESIDVNTEYVDYENIHQLQDHVYSLPGMIEGQKYGFIVSEQNPMAAIPAATWIAHAGGVLMFTSKDKLSNDMARLLSEQPFKKIFIVGEQNEGSLPQNTTFETEVIPYKDPESFSVEFAKFYDANNFVGWGYNNTRKDNSHNYILSSRKEKELSALSTQLAYEGKIGPLLWTDGERLSSVVGNYLWLMKPNFWVTPTEGPFNSVWIIGDQSKIDFSVQGRVDYSQEIQNYETLGEQAVSGLDTLSILSLLISLCSALWVSAHIYLRMKSLFILTKIMWVLIVLLLGPIGLIFYIISYRAAPWMSMNNNLMWKRPLWNQALVAAIMGVSFGAAAMTATAFIVAWLGQPLTIIRGTFFFLGNPMIVQMIIMYIVAFLCNALIFMPTMLMKMRKLSYYEGVKNSLLTVFISMTSVSLGKMVSMWWLQMVYSPMMPEENHVLWWGFMQLSILIGLITAYIPNWYLVRYGRKMGTM